MVFQMFLKLDDVNGKMNTVLCNLAIITKFVYFDQLTAAVLTILAHVFPAVVSGK